MGLTLDLLVQAVDEARALRAERVNALDVTPATIRVVHEMTEIAAVETTGENRGKSVIATEMGDDQMHHESPLAGMGPRLRVNATGKVDSSTRMKLTPGLITETVLWSHRSVTLKADARSAPTVGGTRSAMTVETVIERGRASLIVQSARVAGIGTVEVGMTSVARTMKWVIWCFRALD
jgi:hypothetical protein